MNHIVTAPSPDSPTLRTAMARDMLPAIQARMLALRLNADLDAGLYRRLNDERLRDLRGVVWALDGIAVGIEAGQPQPVRKRAWWRIWG
jgi:hypothetical protein